MKLIKKMAEKSKQEIIKKYQKNPKDTGSSEVQVALLTARIDHLTGHLQNHRKDFSSRRGLIAMSNQRRKFLNYLKKNDLEKYNEIITRLEIRR